MSLTGSLKECLNFYPLVKFTYSISHPSKSLQIHPSQKPQSSLIKQLHKALFDHSVGCFSFALGDVHEQ